MSLADEHSTAHPARLSPQDARTLAGEVPAWTLTDDALSREFRLPDFPAAIAFVTRVAEVAQAEDHHPDIFISYNRVRLTLSTHQVGGVSHNDFVVAAKVDRIV